MPPGMPMRLGEACPARPPFTEAHLAEGLQNSHLDPLRLPGPRRVLGADSQGPGDQAEALHPKLP